MLLLRILSLAFLFFNVYSVGFAQSVGDSLGTIRVIVTIQGKPIDNAIVALYLNNVVINGGETDTNGVKVFSQLKPGVYYIKVCYADMMREYTNIHVSLGQTEKIIVEFVEPELEVEVCICHPIRKSEAFPHQRNFDYPDIKNSP